MPTAATAIVDRLTVHIPTPVGVVHAATDVSLAIPAGQITALVGESGCGKSVLASALCGLLPAGARHTGTLTIAGRDMSTATERSWRRLRGRTIGLAAQSAAASFTPNRTIGRQLAETIAAVDATTSPTALLEQVGLAPHTQHLYPHELSGGMAQRVAVAAAITANPPLLVADEPTAGLDPDTTRTILTLLRAHADAGGAVLLITHDLHALETTGVADQIAVMYASRIIETGRATDVLASPRDDYTRALLAALPTRGLHPIPGMPPELTDLDPNCTFADRLAATRKVTQ
ncbi:ABC transporter ATP-binding protein [Prescottella subtropica]|uniref:ABC transporter ATP-binding protein n=1 Tax=Prescottella subtropica TaxID=2545757 RepID=UPI0010F5A948|nr:ABC transporter ATP-binding protein [Prescottella subtropica]